MEVSPLPSRGSKRSRASFAYTVLHPARRLRDGAHSANTRGFRPRSGDPAGTHDGVLPGTTVAAAGTHRDARKLALTVFESTQEHPCHHSADRLRSRSADPDCLSAVAPIAAPEHEVGGCGSDRCSWGIRRTMRRLQSSYDTSSVKRHRSFAGFASIGLGQARAPGSLLRPASSGISGCVRRCCRRSRDRGRSRGWCARLPVGAIG